MRAHLVVTSRLSDIGHALSRIHADKTIKFTIDLPDNLAVACEALDFDEMLGNLLENAFKWTDDEITVHARLGDRLISIIIEDNGPGIAADQMLTALRPGARLDESAPGFGFGLSITRELAELYGGGLEMGSSPTGGLLVCLELPAAIHWST